MGIVDRLLARYRGNVTPVQGMPGVYQSVAPTDEARSLPTGDVILPPGRVDWPTLMHENRHLLDMQRWTPVGVGLARLVSMVQQAAGVPVEQTLVERGAYEVSDREQREAQLRKNRALAQRMAARRAPDGR